MSAISNPPEFGDLGPDELSRIGVNLVERLSAIQELGVTPGAAVGLSDEFFDALYTLGVRYYGNRQYEQAGEIFKTLGLLQPDEVRNFKAMGANFLGLRNYDAAIEAYTRAYLFAATDADTSFYLGQAFFFKKEYEEARGHLRFAQELARRQPALWPGIEAWAEQLLQRMDTPDSDSSKDPS